MGDTTSILLGGHANLDFLDFFFYIGLFIIGLIRSIFMKRSFKSAVNAIKEIDYFTILLLAGLFVVIGGITKAGIVQDISELFVIYTLIVWASVLLSAFIDNIPYVATMLPVTAGIAAELGVDSAILYFRLLSGATLGGNLTPIGASANITGLGIFAAKPSKDNL